ncbi:MAG: hypothetical protein LQ351_005430 [Letrouitia transgressa]|nr:MAG: hypothetical protein LQ351_005430 [Letrouitia transgressa]
MPLHHKTPGHSMYRLPSVFKPRAVIVNSHHKGSPISASASDPYGGFPRPSSRGYFWSRKCKRSSTCYPESLKNVEQVTWASRNSYKDALLDSYPYLRDSLRCRFLYSQSRHLSNFWGKHNEAGTHRQRSQHKSKITEDDPFWVWADSYDKMQRNMAEEFELFKKRIHDDPYGALFGRRIFGQFAQPLWGLTRDAADVKNSRNTTVSQENTANKSADNFVCQETSKKSQPRNASSAQMSSGGDAIIAQDSVLEEFEIDPITMRKVPKRSKQSISVGPSTAKGTAVSFDIPVKCTHRARSTIEGLKRVDEENFVGRSTKESMRQGKYHVPENSSEEVQPKEIVGEWLAQEGFKEDGGQVVRTQSDQKVLSDGLGGLSEPPQKMQSALDRQIIKENQPKTGDKEATGLRYDITENKADDVDLLRVSDVRASSRTRSFLRDSSKQKEERRDKLQADFDALRQVHEDQVNEILAIRRRLNQEKERIFEIKRRQKLDQEERNRNKINVAHDNEIQVQKAAMEAFETGEVIHRSNKQPTSEHNAQPGEGDMAMNVHEFAGRDRWYKRKAPHAIGGAEKKAIQAAKDRSLVREIRGIYEDAYGLIDAKHRQPVQGSADKAGPEDKCELSLTELREPKTTSVDRFAETVSPHQAIREPLEKCQDTVLKLNSVVKDSPNKQSVRSQTLLEEANGSASEQPIPINIDMESSSKAIYCILAYDQSQQKAVKTILKPRMELSSKRSISISEALSCISEPTKLSSSLNALVAEGYRIESCDANVLVLKKAQEVDAVVERASTVKEKSAINPIDGTTTTGNFASPTGFVNHDSVLPPSDFESEGFGQRINKVRRKEPVFSGSSRGHWQEKQRSQLRDKARRKGKWRRAARRRKTAKLMIWVGLWTALCCYAVGLVTEFLRLCKTGAIRREWRARNGGGWAQA